MKKMFAVLVAVVVLFSFGMAQDNMGTKAGDKSLNFAFGGLGAFGIGTPNAYGGFSYSYFLSGDAALRVGLNVGTTSTTTPAAATGFTDGSTSSFSLGLGGDYLMYMTGATSRVRPYMGAGVSVGLASSNTKYSVANSPANGTKVEETNTVLGNEGFSFNVGALAGAEFYLYPELSLSAEYRFGLLTMTSRADNVQKIQGAADVTNKGGSSMNLLGFGATAVMLHIYF